MNNLWQAIYQLKIDAKQGSTSIQRLANRLAPLLEAVQSYKSFAMYTEAQYTARFALRIADELLEEQPEMNSALIAQSVLKKILGDSVIAEAN